MKQRIEWLAVLRGLNILLVVMVHVQLVDMSTGTNHPFCSAVAFPFHPIRMPLFIFISGGLLYLSRIRKNISTKALYKDKFQRIMIPFLFFVIAYYVLRLRQSYRGVFFCSHSSIFEVIHHSHYGFWLS